MTAPREPEPAEPPPRASQSTIEIVHRIEREARRRRTRSERVSQTVVRAVGQPKFVIGHLIAVALWIGVNLGVMPGLHPFDPFPFGILTMIVSAEGVFLAILILISQNALDRQADHRARLALQISLLAEREITKALRILHEIAIRMEIEEPTRDPEAKELAQETDVESLSRDLERTVERSDED